MGVNGRSRFSMDVLAIDPRQAAESIEHSIKGHVTSLRRRGVVVGLSGGIDSSVVTWLSVRALGAERVQVLLMPERDSSSDSLMLGRLVSDALGVPAIVEDISPLLAAAGCYVKQDEAIRTAFPEYGEGYRCKLTLPSILERERLNISELTIETPTGRAQDVALVIDCLSPVRRRHELQAAHSENDRVLPRGSASLRRRRHAKSSRVRPGVLRETRETARRTSSQSRTCTRPRFTRWPNTSACPKKSGDGRRRPTHFRCHRHRKSSTFRCLTS